MAKYTYLLLDSAVFLIPLFFALLPRYPFLKHRRQILLSITAVAVPMILWDQLAAHAGHWAFNPQRVVGIYLGDLPLEELLFFIVVPFACLFGYFGFRQHFQPRSFPALRPVILAGAVGLTVYLVLGEPPAYTRIVLLVTVLVVLADQLTGRHLMTTTTYWIAMLVAFAGFLIGNSILTGIPVVTYGPAHHLGIRIGTIPVEDFFYNFVLISANIMIFDRLVYKETGGRRRETGVRE